MLFSSSLYYFPGKASKASIFIYMPSVNLHFSMAQFQIPVNLKMFFPSSSFPWRNSVGLQEEEKNFSSIHHLN
jgi:hypothetical protein